MSELQNPVCWGVFARIDGQLVWQPPMEPTEDMAKQSAARFVPGTELEIKPMGVLTDVGAQQQGDLSLRDAVYEVLYGLRIAPRHQCMEAAEKIAALLAAKPPAATLSVPPEWRDVIERAVDGAENNGDSYTAHHLRRFLSAIDEAGEPC